MTAVHKVVARRLIKTFGPVAALRGVSAELKAGELTLIDGPNGSGKSTLLRIVGTLLRPTSGTVTYEPLGRSRPAVRSEVGWLSHDALAYPELSGRYNIELAARLHGLDPAEAWRRSVDDFDLGGFAERPLHTNSRGQRQRVALARALVHEPSLLLLDEPTTGLDVAALRRLLEVIVRLIRGGAIVAVVSHELERFSSLDAKPLTLDRGRVLASS